MSTRTDINLDKIRHALNSPNPGSAQDLARRAVVAQRLKNRPIGIIPERVSGEHNDFSALFKYYAQEVHTHIIECNEPNQAISAISEYLQDHQLPLELWYGGDSAIEAMNWAEHDFTLSKNRDLTGKKSGIVHALAAVAETGTILIDSGAEKFTSLNFLPDCAIVLCKKSSIYPSYEAAMAGLDPKNLPRTINFISGPSRTGDIAQKLELGAHGPVHFIVVLY